MRCCRQMRSILSGVTLLVLTHFAALAQEEELEPTVERLAYDWSFCIYMTTQDNVNTQKLPPEIIDLGFQNCKERETDVYNRLIAIGKSSKEADELMLKIRDEMRREFMEILCDVFPRRCASS
jgi:hypothetical protein